ncbi:amidohydrolase family protein [Martelella radicis]|uniref:D-galactarolactone isomerase n=1 Tax=Martelella radicis TaxID=1397476 RepID=A0A7W6KNQ1_9HYPH|nr:amidohydrolase family protein [Martelella radicis]MBB4124607.1 D-galactarolactone isomerase [Martelella radicis]
MFERRLDGEPPKTALPPGTIDTQMHMYLPGYPALDGGPALPREPLPGPAAYRRLMSWLGIDRVVITQGNAHQYDNGNLLACLDAMGPDVARGVAVIGSQTSEAELRQLADAGVTGARIMDLPGGAIGLEGLAAVDSICADMDWMIAVQFDGSDIAAHEAALSALKSRWVLDHHGKFFRGIKADGPEVSTLKKLIDQGNCYFKFAGCYESSRSGGPDYADIAAVARVIAAHAPERIVWGTNWPHNMAQSEADYPDDALLTDIVLSWLPDTAARQLALVDNPQALYQFAR